MKMRKITIILLVLTMVLGITSPIVDLVLASNATESEQQESVDTVVVDENSGAETPDEGESTEAGTFNTDIPAAEQDQNVLPDTQNTDIPAADQDQEQDLEQGTQNTDIPAADLNQDLGRIHQIQAMLMQTTLLQSRNRMKSKANLIQM